MSGHVNTFPNIPNDIATLQRLLAEYREREVVREAREASLIDALDHLAYDCHEGKGSACFVTSFDKTEDVTEIFTECQAYSDDLPPVETVGDRIPYGADWTEGSIIEMYGERLRIRKNWGSSGEVECLDGEFVSNKYYWELQGDKAKLIALGVAPLSEPVEA